MLYLFVKLVQFSFILRVFKALQVLRVKEQSSIAGTPNGAQREAVREMQAFVEKNRVRLEDVSVKELIHEGRRL